jgi:hypothetical protein
MIFKGMKAPTPSRIGKIRRFCQTRLVKIGIFVKLGRNGKIVTGED